MEGIGAGGQLGSSAPQRPLVVVVLALYALLGGLISFLAWVLDVPRFADWLDTGVWIQPNTCVLMALGGAGVLLLQLDMRRTAIALGGFVALAGGATLLQYIAGADFGFNHQLLFGRQWGDASTVTPGMMGPPASSSFLFIGTAIVLLGMRRAESERAPVSAFVPPLGLAVCALTLFSIMGYIFGAQQFYSIPWLTAIALQTSTMLLALGWALVASVPERQPMRLLHERSGAGAMARVMLPGLIILIPLLLVLRVEGQEAELYDEGTGRALGALSLTFAATGLVWAALVAAQRREQGERRTMAALRDQEARLRAVFATVIDGVITIDERGTIESANPAAERLFGYAAREMIGRNISMLMPEPHRSEHDAYLANYRATGVAKIIGIGREVVGLRKDGSTFPMDLAVSEMTVGGRRMFTGLVHDVSDRKQHEQTLSIMARELSHRVKNTLAMVQSIASQTARHSPSVEAFNQAFAGRLQSLANIHGLLTRGRWEGARMREVIFVAMSPFPQLEAGAIRMEAEDFMLDDRQVLGVSMVLHELATNAVKYGSLSSGMGRVTVKATTLDGQALVEWLEQGGPPVDPPRKSGFGSTLISQLCSYELGGSAALEYESSGLSCRIEFPLRERVH